MAGISNLSVAIVTTLHSNVSQVQQFSWEDEAGVPHMTDDGTRRCDGHRLAYRQEYPSVVTAPGGEW